MTSDNHFDDFPTDHDDVGGESMPHEDIPVDDHEDHETETWESFDENADDEPRPGKKKRTNQIIIGVAVLAGLIIIVLKMSGGGTPAPRSAQRTAPPVATAATTSKTPAVEATAAKPALNLPPTREDIIYGAAPQTGNEPTPTPVPAASTAPMQSGGFLNDPNALKKVEALQAAHVTANAPAPAPVPALKLPATLTAVPPMPTPITTSPPATPASPTQTADTNSGNAAVNGQLKDIAAQLALIKTQLQDLQNTTPRRTEVADLQTQVMALKTQIGQQPAMQAATGPVEHSTRKTPRPKTHHAAAKAAALTGTVSSHWILKSAQPGMAIVDAGDGALVTVKAGDHLKGLGTIQSIVQQDGQWVVKGSGGQITQ